MTEYFSSEFEPFSLLEFSGQDPLAQRIYESMREMLGPAFQQEDQDAETLADAMCIAVSQLQLEAAAAQDDPTQVSYLIADIERDYKIIPPYDATLEERRAAILAASYAARGALSAAVLDGLQTIFGDNLVHWRPVTMAETTLDSAPTFVPPTTPIKLVSLSGPILPGTSTVGYLRLVDDGNPILKGDRLTVDAGRLGLEEGVIVADATPAVITATFTKTHENGTLATTAPWPRWCSNKCHSLVVVVDIAAVTAAQLDKTHAFMRKAMTGASTWVICGLTGTSPNRVGPFTVGGGRIGQTPISTTTIAVGV